MKLNSRVPSGTDDSAIADPVINMANTVHSVIFSTGVPTGANSTNGTTQTSAVRIEPSAWLLISARPTRRRSESPRLWSNRAP